MINRQASQLDVLARKWDEFISDTTNKMDRILNNHSQQESLGTEVSETDSSLPITNQEQLNDFKQFCDIPRNRLKWYPNMTVNIIVSRCNTLFNTTF